MKVFSITSEGKLVPYSEKDFKDENLEEQLENWLEANPDCILEDEDVLLIGRQVTTNLGSIIDLLGIDREGNLVVIELKRDRTPRDTLAQILEYASYVEELTLEQLEQLWIENYGEIEGSLPEYHREYFQLEEDEAASFNKDLRLVIVGQEIIKEVRQTSKFLQKRGLNVSCLEFKYFTTRGGEQIISTDFVVGKETEVVNRINWASQPKTTRESFLASVDQFGEDIFAPLLEFAESHGLPIIWGTKGFSVNARVDGADVCLICGFPPQAKSGQAIITKYFPITKNVNDGQAILDQLQSELKGLGVFESTGKQVKWKVTGYMDDVKKKQLFDILLRAEERIQEKGLVGSE